MVGKERAWASHQTMCEESMAWKTVWWKSSDRMKGSLRVSRTIDESSGSSACTFTGGAEVAADVDGPCKQGGCDAANVVNAPLTE